MQVYIHICSLKFHYSSSSYKRFRPKEKENTLQRSAVAYQFGHESTCSKNKTPSSIIEECLDTDTEQVCKH